MFIGKDFAKARLQAQANAKQTGKPWVVWGYNGWHTAQADSFFTHFPDNAVVFLPDPHNPCRGAFSCLQTGRCPNDPVCNN